MNQVILVPGKREKYPTEESVKECFFDSEESDQIREDITEGPGRKDWLELIDEVRAVAFEARRKLYQQQQQQQGGFDQPIRRLLTFFGFQ